MLSPEEACLIFGTGAYCYEENLLGRSITQDEALAILDSGLEAGLVLHPATPKNQATFETYLRMARERGKI
jgi:electron transport complex protein RnfB